MSLYVDYMDTHNPKRLHIEANNRPFLDLEQVSHRCVQPWTGQAGHDVLLTMIVMKPRLGGLDNIAEMRNPFFKALPLPRIQVVLYRE